MLRKLHHAGKIGANLGKSKVIEECVEENTQEDNTLVASFHCISTVSEVAEITPD